MKLLLLKSGNMCAFPGCRQRLTEDATATDDSVVLADMAHIVGFSRKGPRGIEDLNDEERNDELNLLLVCKTHHKIIDDQPLTYSWAVLQQVKSDHEAWVRSVIARPESEAAPSLVRDCLYGSALPLTHIPQAVYVAPSEYTDGEEGRVARQIVYPHDRSELVPFLLRDGHRLYSFHDLHVEHGPFEHVVDWAGADRLDTAEFCNSVEGQRRFVTLLNSAVRRYTVTLGVRFDREHRRFYFIPDQPGDERIVRYRPLTANSTTRKVVWQPRRKATGEARNYWVHLACGLQFENVGQLQWVLTIRPEYHFTLDGETLLPSDQIGKRATRLKSRMYNFDYLGELQFWRDFICGGNPRLILNFGAQSAVISSTLLPCDIDWPGIPDDTKAFKNVAYGDDLFTLADFEDVTRGDDSEWEDEEAEADEDW